jgi:glycogen synthase
MGGLLLSDHKVLMLLDNPFVSDARVEKEAIALLNQGASVEVWCEMNTELPLEDERNGIKIVRKIDPILYAPLKKGYKAALATIVFEITKKSFNVLHCHDFHMLTIGSEVKKRNNSIQLIYDAHEYLKGWPYYQTTINWKNRMKGWVVWTYLKSLEKKNSKRADAVVTVTKGMAERLKNNNRLGVLPIVLGNFPKGFNLNVDKNYFHEKFNLSKDSKIIVHSGTIYHTEKQLKDLFDSICSLPDTYLVFIGNRPRFFELKAEIKLDAALAIRILFHDYCLNQDDNINLLAAADIGLMHIRDRWLAHKITFSNRFVEYIMAGIPVVATPQEFTQELNDNYHCCEFYTENSKEQLKQCLVKILGNLKLYSDNANEAKKELDWENESAKLITLYSSLVVK